MKKKLYRRLRMFLPPKWRLPEKPLLLGTGSTGSIFKVISSKNAQTFAAAKLQRRGTLDQWLCEIEAHSKFSKAIPSMVPRLYYTNALARLIVMEHVEGERLDRYLAVQRAPEELGVIAENLTSVFAALRKHKLTHGDMALFNVIIDPKTLQVRLIDFDRASHRVYRPWVDRLRFANEWWPEVRSAGTAEIEASNAHFMQQQTWLLPRTILSCSVACRDLRWEKMYNAYMRRATQ